MYTSYKGIAENPTGRNPHTEPVTIEDCERWAALIPGERYWGRMDSVRERLLDACDADRRTLAKADGRRS